MDLRQKLSAICHLFLPYETEEKVAHFQFDDMLQLQPHPILEQLSDQEIDSIASIFKMISREESTSDDVGLLLEALIRKHPIEFQRYFGSSKYVCVETRHMHNGVSVKLNADSIIRQLNIQTSVFFDFQEVKGNSQELDTLFEQIDLPSVIRINYPNTSEDIFSESKLNETNAETLLFWSIVKSKTYILAPQSKEAFEAILKLPSPTLVKKIFTKRGITCDQSYLITSIERQSAVDHPLVYLNPDYDEEPFSFWAGNLIPSWVDLESLQEAEDDIEKYYHNIYLITCDEQAMLNMIVCAGLFQDGTWHNFLTRDLFDPRILNLINCFALSDDSFFEEFPFY